ncbi:LCCL domain-containing protein [Roseivivax sp. CAU 1753]
MSGSLRKGLYLILIAGLALFAPAPEASAQECVDAFKTSRARLHAIQADLKSNKLSQETVAALSRWRDAFQADVKHASLTETVLLGGAGGVGMSVLGAVATGGPPGWAAAVLGALFSVGLNAAYAEAQSTGLWTRAEANTSFYQYVLDYSEYGRVGDVTSPDFQDFITQYRALLTKLAGTSPPTDPTSLNLYMQANADRFLLFFGYFEETAGAAKFPRWRFPQAQGKYGPHRLGVGYYQPVMRAKLAEELRLIDQAIAALSQAACHPAGTPLPAAVPAITACGARPALDQSVTCICDTTTPGNVWGSDMYTSDSSICGAAIHAGLARPSASQDGAISYRGVVTLKGARGCPFYRGSTARGITTASYGEWGGSFYFPGAQSGQCQEGTRPDPGTWYCPATMRSQGAVLSCFCAPHATTFGAVWGTGEYTDDSSVCRAARHAGAVSDRGGMVRVARTPGRASYTASQSNGVSTHGYGVWGGSFRFQ